MINKCLLIGPNAGVSMGKGGGCRVTVKMAEALLERGFDVSLCAFRGYSIYNLDRMHNTNLVKSKTKLHTYFLLNVKNEGINVLSSILPPHVGVFPFSIYLRRVIRSVNPHILIFHDDVLLSSKNELLERQTLLYVHFSYATRLKLSIGDITEIKEPFVKRALKKALDPMLRWLIIADEKPANVILANSSVTANYLKRTWNRNDVIILHPPVDTSLYKPLDTKYNIIVSVGAIQPNKRFGDVIKAFSLVKSKCKLIIIGHYLSGAYYCYLQKLIKKLGLREKAMIVLDADQKQVSEILSKAKVILHASKFEPFGIAVVEGMASGCVPIVYKGFTSGPWIDIINEGEFGLGFRSIDEAAENIERVLNDNKIFNHYRNASLKRSRDFDVSSFKRKFIEIMQHIT